MIPIPPNSHAYDVGPTKRSPPRPSRSSNSVSVAATASSSSSDKLFTNSVHLQRKQRLEALAHKRRQNLNYLKVIRVYFQSYLL